MYVVCIGLAAPHTASAQSPSEACVVLLSGDTSVRVSRAIQVELQLSGCRVVMQTSSQSADADEARELAAHASAEVFELQAGAIRRVEPGGRELRQPLYDAHPRAVAALAGWLRSRPFHAPTLEPDSSRRTPVAQAVQFAQAFQLAPPTQRARGTAHRLRPTRQQLSRPEPSPAPHVPLPLEERVAWELLGGVGAGVALGAAAAALAGALTPADDPFQWWAVGLVAGGTVGVGLGVLLAGRLAGEDGDPFWTLVGAVLGGVLAAGMLALGYALDQDPTDGVDTAFNFLGIALGVVAPPLFSVLAFELTVPD